MTGAWKQKIKRGIVATTLCVTMMPFVLLGVGCGRKGSNATPDASLGPLDPQEALICSDEYAGYLVLHLDESIGARLSTSKTFTSRFSDKATELSAVQSVIDAYPSASLERSVATDPAQLDARRAELEKI